MSYRFRRSTGISSSPGLLHINHTGEDIITQRHYVADVADDTGAHGSFFDVYKVRGGGGEWNGSYTDQYGAGFTCENFVPGELNNPFYSDWQSDLFWDSPSDGALATKLLKLTNPSRPYVDIPTNVFELRDIPHMLKVEGDTILKKGASLDLLYQFGWAPLVSDLVKLTDFQSAVSKRTNELSHLYQSGLRRKKLLNNIVHSSNYNAPLAYYSYLGNIYYKVSRKNEEKAWGYVEWFPTTLPPATDEILRALARRAVLGLTIDPSTVWELIPWSWLVDWCSNVGDFIASHRNIIPAEPRNILIMRHRTSYAHLEPLSWSGVGISQQPAWMECDWKSRRPASPELSAQLPFLSGRQLSILASIGVLRR